jgi:hypothetical protein
MIAEENRLCVMPMTIELQPLETQTAFNIKRWSEILNDPELARLPHRIETDRHGHIVMTRPPAPFHAAAASGGVNNRDLISWRCRLSQNAVLEPADCTPFFAKPQKHMPGALIKETAHDFLRPGRRTQTALASSRSQDHQCKRRN